MHIVGTAGHVDHGKSALVQALTGTNPDRWLEEQLRGMTLDLGFAHLPFADGVEAGIVDVPGHERFLHNMLAGAAGMELLLLVVAADEGVMPQTVEHLQILRYLNVRQVLLVVTKCDLLSGAPLEEAVRNIRAELRGTIAQEAPVLNVSSTTGTGIEELREAIHDRLKSLPARGLDAPAYLPVDRVFALPGRGTIVTGTLMQGRIATGDQLFLQPSGKKVRVRSLQTFGAPKALVESGARVAANLPGLEVGEISRGEMLVAPELLPANSFRVRFEPLAERRAMLRKRNPVRAYIGSAEILGTLAFAELAQSDPISGELFLRKATVAYPGTAFVVSALSPKILLGGGTIEAASLDRADTEQDGNRAAILAVLRAEKLRIWTAPQIAREANLRENIVETELQGLLQTGEIFSLSAPVAYIDARAADEMLSNLLAHLDQLHRAEPWAMGATSVALARALELDERTMVRLLDLFAHEGRIARRAGYYARTDHEPALASEQKQFFEQLLHVDAEQPLLPASLSAAVAQVKGSRIPGIGKAFDTLFAKGALIKVNGDVYRRSQIASIRAHVESFLQEHGRMTMAEFRDLIGTSRKYAVPLLEWFDSRGITVRSGDYRALRSKQ